MAITCWIPSCNHNNMKNRCAFYRFPKNVITQKWMKMLRPESRICSCHFKGGKKESGLEITFIDNATENQIAQLTSRTVVEGEFVQEEPQPSTSSATSYGNILEIPAMGLLTKNTTNSIIQNTNNMTCHDVAMANWEKKLISELNTIMISNVRKLAKVINDLEPKIQQEWIETLKEEVNDKCVLLVEEASFFVAVKHLRQTYFDLCEKLRTTPMVNDLDKLTLYEEKNLLESRVKACQDEIKIRQKKLQELSSKQIKLCKLLDSVQIIFTTVDVIPTETQLKALNLEVLRLEREHNQIVKNYHELQFKVKNILPELNLKVRPEFKEMISAPCDNSLTITRKEFQNLKNYYEQIKQKYNIQEYQLLESLQNVIAKLYNTCHIAEHERKITSNIHQYPLDDIQTEISNLKMYWEDCRKLFSLLGQYRHYWTKLTGTLECSDTSRDTIKVVIDICKQICSIEAELVEAAISYEKKNARSFTSFGKTIPDIIIQYNLICTKYKVTRGSTHLSLSDVFHEIYAENHRLPANNLPLSEFQKDKPKRDKKKKVDISENVAINQRSSSSRLIPSGAPDILEPVTQQFEVVLINDEKIIPGTNSTISLEGEGINNSLDVCHRQNHTQVKVKTVTNKPPSQNILKRRLLDADFVMENSSEMYSEEIVTSAKIVHPFTMHFHKKVKVTPPIKNQTKNFYLTKGGSIKIKTSNQTNTFTTPSLSNVTLHTDSELIDPLSIHTGNTLGKEVNK